MFSDSITHPTDTQVSIHALAEAATIGGYAPSNCNTQPWRWRLAADTLELCLASERIMPVTDPEARLATLSCGADLHHAHAALRAQGWDAWQAELAVWAGGTRPPGSGVPDAAIPDRATQTTVPGRDFGHYGDLPVSAAHDESAVFVTLYGPGDDPIDWLRAGEACPVRRLADRHHARGHRAAVQRTDRGHCTPSGDSGDDRQRRAPLPVAAARPRRPGRGPRAACAAAGRRADHRPGVTTAGPVMRIGVGPPGLRLATIRP
ncbi:hypothetical protein Q0Z83_000410 [Actinoplanes sichuanensis]|nr:hypothetical protein Q0Z83_000410 [Actinoplanes sichuanensis]